MFFDYITKQRQVTKCPGQNFYGCVVDKNQGDNKVVLSSVGVVIF